MGWAGWIGLILALPLLIGLAGLGWVNARVDDLQAGTKQAQEVMTTTAQAGLKEISEPFPATIKLVHGPAGGNLPLRSKFVSFDCADVSLLNFVAESGFYNPYPASEAPWDYGFLFRRSAEGGGLRLYVSSDGSWHFLSVTSQPAVFTTLQDGRLELRREQNETNTLKLVARGGEGYFYANNSLVARLDLSSHARQAAVCVAAGFDRTTERDQYSTLYQDFNVWHILP